MQHGDGKCPECGEEMHMTHLPNITQSHFTAARRLANTVWDAAALEEESSSGTTISVVCLTAALLLKRAAVNLQLPLQMLPGLAQYYLHVAHEIIQARRAEARMERELN